MILKLEIPFLKPVALNHSHIITTINGRPRKIKTTITRQYEEKLLNRLNQYQKEFDEFNRIYDPLKHYIEINFRFYMPIFLKDMKRLSKTKGDWDGLPKVTQDVIFKKIKADDHAICNGSVKQIHSEDYKILVEISLIDLNTIK